MGGRNNGGKNKFQFHTGSIKSQKGSEDHRMLVVNLFQFHTGSIKSKRIRTRECGHRSFNSILVRLKAHQKGDERQQRDSFNSILVRLKVCQYVVRESQYIKVSIPYWFD